MRLSNHLAIGQRTAQLVAGAAPMQKLQSSNAQSAMMPYGDQRVSLLTVALGKYTSIHVSAESANR